MFGVDNSPSYEAICLSYQELTKLQNDKGAHSAYIGGYSCDLSGQVGGIIYYYMQA